MNLLHGAILINKAQCISSFGIIERLRRALSDQYQVKKSLLPKLGHGGTLDPFATGLMVICIGDGVKLARYFLGGDKTYTGTFKFGETSISGDATNPISETSELIPTSLEELRTLANSMTHVPYAQTPPMHSAKKIEGKPLYELARQGIEIDREAKICTLKRFDIESYSPPCALFRVECTSGTYIRVLSQDFARKLGTVALCETLHREVSGNFRVAHSLTLEQLEQASRDQVNWTTLSAFVPFNQMLEGIIERVAVTPDEARAIFHGKQFILPQIAARLNGAEGESKTAFAAYSEDSLIAVARREASEIWVLERVFTL